MSEIFARNERVIDVITDSQLSGLIADGKSPLLLFFWADWHEPSRRNGQMDSLFQSLSKKFLSIEFARVEAESIASATEMFSVSVVPTFIGIFRGQSVQKVEGADPQALGAFVKTFSEYCAQKNIIPQAINAEPPINQRLRSLINSAPVMLFMKGSPDAPRCGFSNKIVKILRDNDIFFASFDILSDNEVREGLKKYSDWPTYPQLYANGELIGGLDIVNEMIKSNPNLKEQLNLTTDMNSSSSTAFASTSIEDKLKSLINRAPVMVFMKGSKDAPKCGFSQRMVALLIQESIDFQTFDILEDNEVREELKRFSDWPTYPQLYVRGELIGGLDIVLEMKESGGSLKDQLKL